MPVLPPRLIPPDRPLRIVGDVHGDAVAFSHAVATERYVIQLGDLVDHGPNSAQVLRIMFRLIDEGRGLFLLGNHDRKLGRALAGRTACARTRRWKPRWRNSGWTSALADARLCRDRSRAGLAGGRHAPASCMAASIPACCISRRRPGWSGSRICCRGHLFGETTGRMQEDGFPERRLNWIDHIPDGFTVYCGHDQRSTDGRPWRKRGRCRRPGNLHRHRRRKGRASGLDRPSRHGR